MGKSPHPCTRCLAGDEMTAIAEEFGRTLVVAPHPDDEVLGAGGTIARLTDAGATVGVAVVTKGFPPQFQAEAIAVTRNEAKAAHAALGVAETFWLDQPAAQLAETPHRQVNAALGEVVADFSPDTLLLPFLGDIHIDHTLVFLSSMVAARPNRPDYPRRILAYETLSETNWNAPYVTPGFIPNVFVNITDTLDRKLQAMQMFETQLQQAPNERSVEALRALAVLRGATVHCPAAEGFVHIRWVV